MLNEREAKTSQDSAHVHMRWCSSINEECSARLDLKLPLGMDRFLKAILKTTLKDKKISSGSSELETASHGSAAKNQ